MKYYVALLTMILETICWYQFLTTENFLFIFYVVILAIMYSYFLNKE